jgi:hypothetical protein
VGGLEVSRPVQDHSIQIPAPRCEGPICQLSFLVQAFSRFDVTCYSTIKNSLIRGAYSPFTHRTLVSHRILAVAKHSRPR